MGYLPIFMQVAAASCLVVGGGEVAQRKAESLLEAGAQVTVLSPTLTPALEQRVHESRIGHISRAYETGDMRGYALVFAATNDPALHKALSQEARALSIPLNVADEPELCSFIMPAIVRRGALTVAVSTAGASPAMAKRIANRISRTFGPEYGVALEIIRAARVRLKAIESSPIRRSRALSALAASRLPALVRAGDAQGVERVLKRYAGAGLADLGVSALEKRETQAARE